MSILLMDTAQYPEAASLIAEAIERVDRSRPPAEARLGWFHTARGWVWHCAGTESADSLDHALRIAIAYQPDAPFANKNLGQFLIRLPGREPEGRAILERLTELSVNQVPLDLIGWCHFRLGRHEAAEQWLRAAAAADSDDAAIRFDLALVLLAKCTDEALPEYQRAMTLTARHHPLRQRGLLHIALMDALESLGDGVIERERGETRVAELRTVLLKTGFSAERLAPIEARAMPRPDAGS